MKLSTKELTTTVTEMKKLADLLHNVDGHMESWPPVSRPLHNVPDPLVN
jgi:hypothetical protein